MSSLYAEIEGHRPTRTQFWREKVRQTLRRYEDQFHAVAPGRYALHGIAQASTIKREQLAFIV